MTLNQLQEEVDNWIKTIGLRYFNELTNMAILTEEVGEVARLMSRIYGEQSFKEAISKDDQKEMLADEMSDVLWVLTCLANQTGINLEDAMKANILKKTHRDKERHKSNNKLSI